MSAANANGGRAAWLLHLPAAVVMVACALMTLNAMRTPPTLVLDENREIALLSELHTGVAAQYDRCKAVLLNVGAILTATYPFEADTTANRYLSAWVTGEDLRRRILSYRRRLVERFHAGRFHTGNPPAASYAVVLRTDRERRIQIFRSGRDKGFVANITYTLVDAASRAELDQFSFEVQLVPTSVTIVNPMGFALKRFHPLDPRPLEETTP